MIHLTSNLRDYLMQDRNTALLFTQILNHIESCVKYLLNTPDLDDECQKLIDFSVWYITSIPDTKSSVCYAIADTNEPIQFMKTVNGCFPETKLYLANNGECGYTLMLPEDY